MVMSLPAGTYVLAEGTRPRNPGVRGGDAYERPLREGAHRRRPPAILSCLSDRSERHIASPPAAKRRLYAFIPRST